MYKGVRCTVMQHKRLVWAPTQVYSSICPQNLPPITNLVGKLHATAQMRNKMTQPSTGGAVFQVRQAAKKQAGD